MWADHDPTIGNEQAGVRPVIVLSHDVFNERSGTIIGIALTSKEPRANFPLMLEITSIKLPKRSWAKLGQVRTMSVARLGRKLGRISPEELDRIIEGLNEIIGG
jgi:mRNA interferase MazF